MSEFGIYIGKLTKKYSQDSEAVIALELRDLFVPFGKTVAILGRSGNGKSTLLNVLGLLTMPDFQANDRTSVKYIFPPSSDGIGTVSLTDLWQNQALRQQVLRERFGFIFQDSFLFPGLTIRENLELPQLLNSFENDQIEKMWHKTRETGLFFELNDEERKDQFGIRTPDKYSGGQLQRFALFRSLLHNPSIIFADEPTGNLDPQYADRLFSFLKTWQDSSSSSKKAEPSESLCRTLFVVTHDVKLARKHADLIYIINSAHRVEQQGILQRESSSPDSDWMRQDGTRVNVEEMTALMAKEAGRTSLRPSPVKPINYGTAAKPRKQSLLNFSFSFSKWDFWPKTPQLRWATISGLVATSVLAIISFTILGFYQGAESYLNYVQSNPYIRSLPFYRPLTEAAINTEMLREVATIAASPDTSGWFFFDENHEFPLLHISTKTSGFNHKSMYAIMLAHEDNEHQEVRLRGRTIDPGDPLMRIVRDNLIVGRSFSSSPDSQRFDFGLILSEKAIAKLGLPVEHDWLRENQPRVLYSKHASGIEQRVREYPIIGIAAQLPEPGGDLLVTNYFFAQLVNHYFDPSQIRYFEAGFLDDIREAEQCLDAVDVLATSLNIFADYYLSDDKYVLKFKYPLNAAQHEDTVMVQWRALKARLTEVLSSRPLTLLPFEREERSVSAFDTTHFTYGSLYLRDFKHVKRLRAFLQQKYAVEMDLGMIESLDTINIMRNIIFGIVVVMLLAVGLTGVFVVYSVFNQFTMRSYRQFGVLKAMGVTHRNLLLIHTFQVLFLFGISVSLGIACSSVAGNLFDHYLHSFVGTESFDDPFFAVSPLGMIFLAIFILTTYAVACWRAVGVVYKRGPIELMKDQKEPKTLDKALYS